MRKKLKPCPFCGGEGKIGEDLIAVSERYWVSCYNRHCKVNPQAKPYKNKRDAIKAWNRRSIKE